MGTVCQDGYRAIKIAKRLEFNDSLPRGNVFFCKFLIVFQISLIVFEPIIIIAENQYSKALS